MSTDSQAEKGLGLVTQEEHIKQWAKASGHSIRSVHADEGVSGAKDLDHRDGLTQALREVRDRIVGGIVVYRLDRLARDLVVQEQLLAEVWRLGGEALSTASGEQDLRDDPEDPSRRMIRQILGSVAEYERSMIVLRLKRGRAAKAAQGGYAYGSPPFGAHAVAGQLLKDEDEMATVRRITELHEDGLSLRRIADVLHHEERPSKRGGRWHPQTVARILTSRSNDEGL